MIDFDAVVVGAGPAGSATAIGLARRGASVLLLDRARFPRWKVCGACLSPGALSALHELGVGDHSYVLPGVLLSRFVLRSRIGGAVVPLHGSKATSREQLDLTLVKTAQGCGVSFWHETHAALASGCSRCRVLHVTRSGVREEVTARIVIDATGLGRGWEEPGRPPASEVAPRARIGLGCVLDVPAYPVLGGELHMVVGPQGYVGLVRVEGGALNVAAAVDRRALSGGSPGTVVNDILAKAGLPALDGNVVHGWRGTPALTREAAAGAERLLRIGDAAGYAEPFTGEGMAWALGDARAATEIAHRALDGWHPGLLREWHAYRRARRERSEWVCRMLAAGLRRPLLVDAAVTALRLAPILAAPIVSRTARPPRVLARMPA